VGKGREGEKGRGGKGKEGKDFLLAPPPIQPSVFALGWEHA